MADLNRQPGALAGVSGRDVFNFGGWNFPQFTQFNPSTPLIGQIDAKSNSNYLIKQDTTSAFINEKTARYYRGSAAIAIPNISYSHAPTELNAALGSIDFSVVDQVHILASPSLEPDKERDAVDAVELDLRRRADDERLDVIVVVVLLAVLADHTDLPLQPIIECP